MKNIKRIILSIVILIIGVFSFSNIALAASDPVYIGTEEIRPNETKNIYGGEVKLVSEGTRYKLTLNNVTITDLYEDEEFYGIYSSKDLLIELIGNNTIEATPETFQEDSTFCGIHSRGTIYILGNGTLNINVKNYNDIFGIYARAFVFLGDEDKDDSPTINGNVDGDYDNSTIIFMSNVATINNSNINLKLKGGITYGLYSEKSYTVMINDSDIKMDFETGYEAVFLDFYFSDVLIENLDMQLKGYAKEGYEETYAAGIFGNEKIWIMDSKIVELFDYFESFAFKSESGDDGLVKFDHTDGKDFLFLSNSKMGNEPTIEYNNITNKMVYVSDNSLDDVKQSDIYDIDNLKDENYYVIATDINNKILDGNNQSFLVNSINSYAISTNHFRYLVKNIKIDDILFEETDYILDKFGLVTFTSEGIQKLNALNEGNHKIEINYYFSNPLTIDLNILSNTNNSTTEVIENPNTLDNITLDIIIGLISIIGLSSCVVFKIKYKNK